MQDKKRIIIFSSLLLAFISFYIFRLMYLQLANGQTFLEQSQNRILRKTAIIAPRGEICDRLGRPMVTNRKGYAVYIEKDMVGEKELNDVLLNLNNAFSKNGESLALSFPISNSPYTFLSSLKDDENVNKDYIKFLKANNINLDIDANNLMTYFSNTYNLSKYNDNDKWIISALRYEMENKTKNSSDPFMLAVDVKINTISVIRERYMEFPGVSVEVVPIREYVEDGLASNILGRVGNIFSEEYATLKEKGYKLDDIVGKDGIEKTCEDYLKGKDGVKQVEKNTEGQVTAVIETVNPEPGNNIILTIDEDLQKTAEKSLANRIAGIKEYAEIKGLEGTDVKGGAAVAIDVNTGEILALASYPTYKLSEYNSNFASLVKDPLKPLLNRAISGAYPPGSAFKIVTGIAGLEEKAITTNTTYTCNGKYTFFDSYQPSCYHGISHGTQNIEGALRFSCNGFFFDTARLLGIDKLNKYMSLFGFGQLTGIELTGETKGIMAGIEEREKSGKVWNPGDTIQCGIGQSDNMFTPLQMASYVATIASNGVRYKPHIVKSVKDYHFLNSVTENSPEVVSTVPMSETTIKAIKEGMRRVVVEGSIKTAFEGLNNTLAGKTGTAQVPGGSDNGIFICYAPLDKPQIAIAVMAEHCGEGGYLALVARDILEKYFTTKELNDIIIPENVLLN